MAEDIEVRATIHLKGSLRTVPGGHYLVDPSDPWIKRQMRRDYLVPTKPTRKRRKAEPDE